MEYKVGQVINFIDSQSNYTYLDMTGIKFKIDLYGNTGGTGTSVHASSIIDCMNSNKQILLRVDDRYGAYIGLAFYGSDTDDEGWDARRFRFIVAGDGGSAGTGGNVDSRGTPGRAGLFGESGSSGSKIYAPEVNGPSGGTQSSGYSFGSGGTGTYYSSTLRGGNGGNGWYGGYGGWAGVSGVKSGYTSGGGGSSYLLTTTSYKPNNYFVDNFNEIPTVEDIISFIDYENTYSEYISSSIPEYYASITILDTKDSVECYYDRNTVGTTRPYGEFYLPTLDSLKASLASKLNVNKSNITKLSIDTVDFTIAKGTSSSYPYAVIATSKTLKYTDVAYNTTTNTTSTLRGISNSEILALNPTDASWDNISNNRIVLKIYSSSSLSGTYNNSNTNYWRVYDAGDSIKTTLTVYLTYTLSDGTVSHSTIKYYTGSEWKDCEVFYYNGSEWKQCDVFQYDGSEYKKIGG